MVSLLQKAISILNQSSAKFGALDNFMVQSAAFSVIRSLFFVFIRANYVP